MKNETLTAAIERWLPLSAPAFHVLLGLADGEKHGYAILKEIRRHTEDRVRLNVSTLYGVLQRLEKGGLIREASERPDPALDDERRRYFALTETGRAVLAAEVERLERALTLARAKDVTVRADPEPA